MGYGDSVKLDISQADLNKIEKRLFDYIGLIGSKKNRREVLGRGAKLVADAMKTTTPVGERKQTFRIRANGKRARYVKGNLRMSTRWLDKKLRKDKGATIGPLYRRSSAGGKRGGSERTADGYYAHMVFDGGPDEYKRKVSQPGFGKVRARALAKIRADLQRVERNVGRKLYK